MDKPKSAPIFNDQDFPVSLVRLSILKGTGVDIDELKEKPIIGIVNSHTEMNPGHMHLRALAERAKEGVHAAGGIPFEFGVPAPCDGLTEGNEGMRFVLPQRELIADIIETHVRSMLFDGLVMIASCDKIIPGMIMAAARLDRPTIFLTGGPGAWQIRFSSRMEGSVDHKDYDDILSKLECATCATCGSCELMGTANTFQCMAEALGLTLPGSSAVPAFLSEKLLFARKAGKRIVDMVGEGLTARKVLTPSALENALIVDLAIGGSTNSALHLPAIARELGIDLPLARFNELNRKVPTLIGMSPSGPHGMIDLYRAGGVPAVMKVMAGDLNLEAINVTGGPGMPEALAVTMALELHGYARVALITDGRFSGASAGPCVGHVSPEAYVGGPIAALRDGDEITIDIAARTLEAKLTDDEIEERLSNWTPLERDIPEGYMRRYVKYVGSAAHGAVLD